MYHVCAYTPIQFFFVCVLYCSEWMLMKASSYQKLKNVLVIIMYPLAELQFTKLNLMSLFLSAMFGCIFEYIFRVVTVPCTDNMENIVYCIDIFIKGFKC
eukprot:128397_1